MNAREIFTPEQAAQFLQVNRETVYRYIRDGKLAASQLGRSYRITRRNLDDLLDSTRSRSDITLRDYSDDQLANFLEADQPDSEVQSLIRAFRARANSSHA